MLDLEKAMKEFQKVEGACACVQVLIHMDEIKMRVVEYWNQRAEKFASQRLREWGSEKRDLWLAEFQKHLPDGGPLHILDVGTGTGFFAMLLSSRGHRVTGIDLSGHMINEAKKTAAQLGLPAEFFVMDAESPDLKPSSFDVIITRNLTWALPNLQRAYCSWHGLLKPGGVLLNFDADYCREDANQTLPKNHAHKEISAGLMTEYEHIKDELRPCQRPRPAWDLELLETAGFHKIQVDYTVWKRIYRSFDEFYNPTPIFSIIAKA